MKVTYTIGNPTQPISTVTIITNNPRDSTDELQEYLAKYFSHHGGMQWSVKKE